MHLLWGLLDWTVSKPTVCKHQMTSEPRKLIKQNCDSVMSNLRVFFFFFLIDYLSDISEMCFIFSSRQKISTTSHFDIFFEYVCNLMILFFILLNYFFKANFIVIFFIYMFNFGACKLKEAFYHYFTSHKFVTAIILIKMLIFNS